MFGIFKNLTLFFVNVGCVASNIRTATNGELHTVVTTIASGHLTNYTANIFIADVIRSSSLAAILLIKLMGTNIVSLRRSVNIVLNTSVKAAIAT